MFKAIFGVLLILQTASQAGFEKARVGDIEFVYPPELHAIVPDPVHGAVTLTNFDGKYGDRRVVPLKGFEVLVGVEEGKAPFIHEFVSLHAKGCLSISKSVVRVGKQRAIKVACLNDYTFAQLFETNVLVENGKDLYRFGLTMQADEPDRKSFEAAFDAILSTVKFTK